MRPASQLWQEHAASTGLSLLPCSHIEALFWQWHAGLHKYCQPLMAPDAATSSMMLWHLYKPHHMAGMQVWESAVSLAMTNQRNRIAEVVDAVAQRLVLIGRHEAAAELLQGIDDVPAAVRWVPHGLAGTSL